MGSIHQVAEATWSTNEDVTALAELLDVEADRNAAIGADWTQLGAVAETTGFVEDLLSKLAGWADDEYQRLSADLVDFRVVIWTTCVDARATNLVDLAHEHRYNWYHVCCSFARSCLGNGDDVEVLHYCWDAVTLNSCWCVVATFLDVLKDHWVDAGLCELDKRSEKLGPPDCKNTYAANGLDLDGALKGDL